MSRFPVRLLIPLRGDSVTALTWAITERPRGSIATNAAKVWTLLCVAADVHVTDTTHIPGSENDNCDQLSRRGATPVNSVTDHAPMLDLGSTTDLDLNNDTDVRALVRLCDPAIPTETDTQFINFWTSIRSRVDSFMVRYQPKGPLHLASLHPHTPTLTISEAAIQRGAECQGSCGSHGGTEDTFRSAPRVDLFLRLCRDRHSTTVLSPRAL